MEKQVKRITSRQNAIVGRYRAAARGEDEGLLLDGTHLVAEALAARLPIHSAIVDSSALDRPDVARLASQLELNRVDVLVATAAVMAAVSPVRSPSAIVALAERPAGAADAVFGSGQPLAVVVCDVQDPGNVGAIARVAEAGGATGLIVAGASADPFGWKALRGSMGSALRLPIAVLKDVAAAVADARRRHCRIVASVPRGGQDLFDADLTGAVCLLIGGEGGGLPEEIVSAADARLTIPMRPPVESLNAATTAALVVYEAARQRAPRRPPA